MVHDKDRPAAAAKMVRVLHTTKLQGTATNLHFLKAVVASDGEYLP